MSGSYDRPPGRPPGPPPAPPYADPYENYDSYAEPVTGPYGPGYDYGDAAVPDLRVEPPPRAPAARPDLYAEARFGKRGRRDPAPAAIVPPGSVTGRSLTLVISIMCFLACLTAGAVYMMNQSAAAWLRDIASEVTVQVEPRDKTDVEKTVAEVVQFLQRQPGIARVRALTLEESSKLVAEWLGQGDALKALPVPRLIALQIDRNAPADLDSIRQAVDRQFKGVVIDDHRQWQKQIRTVTRSFALGGLAILLLVGAATTAIIVSATRSALASNREIVEVLHFVGATDRFIAGEFQRHFLQLGVRAGIVGALSAMAVFFTMPMVMELLGGGSVTVAEVRRLVGSGSLDGPGYALLSLVVVVIAALCMVTSRLGVFRILHTRQ